MDVFKTLILDTPTVEGATGTVTSVDLTAGTGISVSGGPITSSGSITVTNTSPDQTVALTGGTGISTSGTYPNFTITNDAPDQTVSIASGTGISVTGSYPSFTVTNSSPSLGGDVVGPASATDNAVVRFDSTTGKLIQDSGVSISDANLLTTTALTVNDNTTLGSSNSDTVTFNARSASEFTPATDNTYDLGRTGHEWRDLYIDGTANIDSLVADTADINGGTIDGTAVGATTPSTVAATTISATGEATAQGIRLSQSVVNRAPVNQIISDGATSNRAIVQTGTTRTALAGAPAATWRGLVYVPSSSILPNASYVFARVGSSTTLPTLQSFSISAFMAGDYLRFRQVGTTTSDYRQFEYTTFRSVYSGQWILLEAYFTNGTSSPVVRVNDIDISSSFTSTTSGTPPDWFTASLVETYNLTGYSAPTGPAPLGFWINGALSDADRTYWKETGLPPKWVVDGGSMVSITAGSFVSGKTYTITAVGTTDFTLIGASANTVGLRFTATGVGSGTGTAVLAGALSLPIQGPAGYVLDGTNQTDKIEGTLTGMAWNKPKLDNTNEINGARSLVATGTNQNVTLTPSGTGSVTTASPVSVTNSTASTSTTTGALTVAGGVGVAGAAYIGGSATFSSSVSQSYSNASTLQITQTNTNTGAGAGVSFFQYNSGAGAGGDAWIRQFAGTENWSFGVDNSDSSAWKVSRSSALGGNDVLKLTSTGAAVTGALSSTGILSGPGFSARKTTATSGLVKIQDEGANVYNVIGSRNNADSAALPLNFQATNFAFNGAVAVTGAITATGNITAYYSDDRLKTKLGNIENALDKVSKLNGFYYEANETAQALGYKPVREVGLSAQQVEAVLPEVVAPAPIDNEYKTLHYERVIPLLVEAIKELKAEIELLKK